MRPDQPFSTEESNQWYKFKLGVASRLKESNRTEESNQCYKFLGADIYIRNLNAVQCSRIRIADVTLSAHIYITDCLSLEPESVLLKYS